MRLAARQTTQPPPANQTTRTATSTPRPAAPTTNPKPPKAKPPRAQTLRTTPKAGGSRNANPSRLAAVETLDPARRAGLLAALRASTSRPEALAVLEPDILDALDAVRAGARVPGKDGSADRQVLFRLAGLPLGLAAGASGSGGGGRAADAIRDVGARLEKALNRAVGQSGTPMRQAPVIREAEIIEEAPSNGHFSGDTHKMDDLVRVTSDPAPAPRRADPPPPPPPVGFLAGWD